VHLDLVFLEGYDDKDYVLSNLMSPSLEKKVVFSIQDVQVHPPQCDPLHLVTNDIRLVHVKVETSNMTQ